MRIYFGCIFIIFLLLSGCVAYEYVPSYQPTPDLRKKGDAFAYLNMRNLNLSYAVSDRYYISTSYSYININDRSNHPNIPLVTYDSAFTTSKRLNWVQGSFGYYKCTDAIQIQTGLTLGYGSLNYRKTYWDDVYTAATSYQYVVNTKHINTAADFLIGAFTENNEISIGIATRINCMNFLNYSSWESGYPIDKENTSLPSQIFIEPKLYLMFIGNAFKVNFQAGPIIHCNKSIVYHNYLFWNIGISYTLHAKGTVNNSGIEYQKPERKNKMKYRETSPFDKIPDSYK